MEDYSVIFSVLSSFYIRQGCPVFSRQRISFHLYTTTIIKKLSVFPSHGCSLDQGEPRNFVCSFSPFFSFNSATILCVWHLWSIAFSATFLFVLHHFHNTYNVCMWQKNFHLADPWLAATWNNKNVTWVTFHGTIAESPPGNRLL